MVLHPHTTWIMGWADRMYAKWGEPPSDVDWIRKLAYHMEEAGNDHPSRDAIQVARGWETQAPIR